jgi:hypothetical protein
MPAYRVRPPLTQSGPALKRGMGQNGYVCGTRRQRTGAHGITSAICADAFARSRPIIIPAIEPGP